MIFRLFKVKLVNEETTCNLCPVDFVGKQKTQTVHQTKLTSYRLHTITRKLYPSLVCQQPEESCALYCSG